MALEIEQVTYDILASAGLEKMPMDWFMEIQAIITEDQARTVVSNYFKGEKSVLMTETEKPADGDGSPMLAVLQLRRCEQVLTQPRRHVFEWGRYPASRLASSMPSKKASKPAVDENEAAPQEPEVDYSGIAKAWENNPNVRAATLKNKTLLQWINRDEVGVVTMQTVAKNVPVLSELLKIYLPQCPDAKTCNVDLLKVTDLRKELCLEDHPGTVHCEAAALKSMVTLIKRRNDGC
ncbi:unnamed protein product, partial [Symbiodinium sp. KB8]